MNNLFTTADQYFLVQLVGYTIGFFFAGVIALYIFYRIFRGSERLIFSILDMIPPLFSRKKKLAE